MNEKLTKFLYVLLRDHLPLGVAHKVLRECQDTSLSDPTLEECAEALSSKLDRPSTTPKEAKQILQDWHCKLACAVGPQVRRLANRFGVGELTVMAGSSPLTLYCFLEDSPEKFFESQQAPGEEDLAFARRFLDDLELYLGRRA